MDHFPMSVMISKEAYEKDPTDVKIVTDYPDYPEPLYMKTSYKGLVVQLGEDNRYHDSDFYAIVWNDEKGIGEKIEYATTRAWTYPNSTSVDAPPEVMAKYHAWVRKCEEEREARTPRRGKLAKIISGKNKDTIGRIFWIGKNESWN